MKRVLALLLTVLMLAAMFPASMVTQAANVTKEGFYLVNWDRGSGTGEYNYVYSMPYTWINSANYTADSPSINIGLYFSGDFSTSNIQAAAKAMHEDFSKRPAGSRYFNLAAMAGVFKDCVKDAIDMEDGVRLVADWLDRFLAEYKAIGGQLDGIAIDLEYNYYTSFYLQSHFCTKYTEGGVTKDPRDLDILQDIVRNERVYQKIIRPQLVEYEKQGLFKFYTQDINPKTGLPDDLSTAVGPEYSTRVPIPVSEISSINRYDDNGGDANSRSTWGFVMQKYLADCITRATYDPLIKYYPDAILSDYGTADVYSWHKTMSSSGGTTGTGVKAGNASNGVFYGSQFSEYFWASSSGSKTRKLYYKPAGYNGTVFDPTDIFTRTLYDANNMKRLLASARDKDGEDAHVNVWVPYFHYANTEKSYGNSPYFTEVMYHLGLANPEPFFGYIIANEVANKAKYYDDPKMGSFKYALQVTDEILTELGRVAGYSDRKAIELPMAWNEDYILSGMYAGGRNIWRITPNTGVVSVKDFKVSDSTPTFSASGVTITFPQGKIIKDSAITQIGSCGYWVETPANVTPVVTTTADRYANDPSFGEDFTNYKTGAFTASSSSMLKTTSGRPDTYWTIKEGTAEIKKHGDNQVLALSGTTILNNNKMASNVTAGDFYAKQQIWEVKVTLPSGNYGDVKLLSCEEADGGVKISGGKVYYDKGGSYQELAGVTLAAGTYIIKREMDFTNMLECASSYTICDAQGNRLGGTEKVPLAAITVPADVITISTTGASAAVELDDFKLYPTGVSTALDVYETGRGRKLSNVAGPRTEDTAYRFTWMNAGDTHQVARIYDAKSGTIIRKIDMAPGLDGVAADVVKVSKGQELQFAVNVREEAPSADAPKEGDNIAALEKKDDEELNNGTGDPILPNETPDHTDVPEATDETNVPTEEPKDTDKKGMGGGMIALIVILSLAVLAGGGYAAFVFVIKPRLAAKNTQEPTEETTEE